MAVAARDGIKMGDAKYEYTRKPRRCPACGAARVATVLYGLPAFSERLKADLDAGRIVLGGCCIAADDPAWQCVECGTQIHRKKKANGIDADWPWEEI